MSGSVWLFWIKGNLELMKNLSRRGFLGTSVGASFAAVSSRLLGATEPPSQQAAHATIKPMVKRPNILYVIMEDTGPQHHCYGEPLVQTPHLDKLAAQGIRFTNAYSAAPVCSASRSSLFTGTYQTKIGAHQHRTWEWRKQPLPAPVRHLCEWFRDAGYFTVNIQPDNNHGGMHGAAGSGKIDLNFLLAGPDQDKSRFFEGNDWNQRGHNQPFFAHITIMETHKGKGWEIARQQPKSELVDPDQLKLASFYPDSPIARDEYANYLDAIHLSDGYVGQLLARLERDGLADSTIVVVSSDHGQCLFRSKQFLYDGGLRIPLYVKFPDGKYADIVREDFVSGIDIAPMLLGFAGIVPPAGAMQGQDPFDVNNPRRKYILAARDRMDTAMDRMRAVRTPEFKYIRNYLPGIPYMQRNPYKEHNYPTWNLVKEWFKQGKLNPVQALFAKPEKPIEELYDLKADPDEVNNLANDVHYESTLKELRKLCDGFVDENDQLVVYEDPLDVFRGFWGRMPEEAKGAGKAAKEAIKQKRKMAERAG
jgi:arylsulfatase A-like enzyme